MNRWLDGAARLAAGGALAVGLVLASRVEVGAPVETSVLRVDLRLSRGTVEICRDRTPEELEALAVHMRRPRVCDPWALTWDLEVAIDGRLVVAESLTGGGARNDRPPTLDLQLPMAPGQVELTATLRPRSTAAPTAEVRAALAQLPVSELRSVVRFEKGRIVILGTAPDADRLALLG